MFRLSFAQNILHAVYTLIALSIFLGDGKPSALKSSNGSAATDSSGGSTGAIAAAAVMGVLNLILIALLVLLFLRHKNIIPSVKDGKRYYEPCHVKTCLRSFRSAPTQTGLYSNRRWLVA